MKKVNKQNKRMGHTTTCEYANRARLNLIITNVSNETIPAQATINQIITLGLIRTKTKNLKWLENL